MNPTVFAVLIAAAILCAGLGVLATIWWIGTSQQNRRIQRRLVPGGVAVGEFEAEGVNPVLQELASRGKAMEGAIDKEGESTRLLAQAGLRSVQQRMTYYVLQALSPVLLAVAAFLLWSAAPPRLALPVMLLLLLIMALILGLLLPRMILRQLAAGRQKRLRAEVPLFIHTLVLLFESGLSLRQAFSSLVREGRGVLPELGLELEGMIRQIEAGGEIAEVLTRTAELLDVPDLTTVCSLLRQVDRYGGEVKEPLLDTLSVIEDRREMELREKVNLVSGRMTVVMVLFFFPALMIFVAGPSWISLIRGLSSALGK
jgi:tight adherence protein C